MPYRVYYTCEHCGKQADTRLTCPICRDPTYCGRECQVSDWNQHRLLPLCVVAYQRYQPQADATVQD